MGKGGGRPGAGRVVAGITLGAGRNVRRGLDLPIDRDIGPAVACRTLAGQTSMVHLGRIEGRVALVAAIAGRSRWNMGRGLTKSTGIVVTGRTTASRHALVTIAGRLPGRRGMADIAGLRRRDVLGSLNLGINLFITTKVTAQALASRPGMAHLGRGKGGKGGMTGVALGASWNVDRRFAKTSCRTVVAGRTAPTADGH